jgi:hypothetical protein
VRDFGPRQFVCRFFFFRAVCGIASHCISCSLESAGYELPNLQVVCLVDVATVPGVWGVPVAVEVKVSLELGPELAQRKELLALFKTLRG